MKGVRSDLYKKSVTYAVVVSMMLQNAGLALALPTGGHVSSGKAKISVSGKTMTIHQMSSNLSMKWASFNVGKTQTVKFVQPTSHSVSMNMISGTSSPAQILGKLLSNGYVYLMDPCGIIFGKGAEVNVGGIGAYAANLSRYGYSGSVSGDIINNGTIVSGTGSTITLSGNNVTNTGTIEAYSGTIDLLSNMTDGTTTVAGVLNASGGVPGANGGTIDTSGSRVNVLSGTVVTTEGGAGGKTGTWVLDPASFYIGMNTGTANDTAGNVLNYQDISGSSLATALNSTNVVIDSTQGAKGALGNIYVNDAVSWNSTNSLTLNAVNNIEVNQAITDSNTTVVQNGIYQNVAGMITLRADDMDIGGVATNTTGGGVPSGIGAVYINTGGSLSTAGQVNVYTNPTNYNTPIANPGTAGGSYANGNSSGSVTVYDLISSMSDLLYISDNQSTTSSENQILLNNYALNTNLGWSTNTAYDFLPIGEYAYYEGDFDGLGHTINNLYESSSVYQYFGLLGLDVGSIKNIGATNVNIFDQNTTTSSEAGGLIGVIYGSGSNTLNNVFTSGQIVSTSGVGEMGGLIGQASVQVVNDSYSSVNIENGFISGGLVGSFNGGIISNSHSTGSLSGGIDTGGGLVGSAFFPTISDSYSSSSVSSSLSGASLGGLVGSIYSSAALINDYSTGSISGSSSSNIGGLVGYLTFQSFGATFYDTYATGKILGGSSSVTGGLIGNINPNGCPTIDCSLFLTSSYATNGNTGSGPFIGTTAASSYTTLSGGSGMVPTLVNMATIMPSSGFGFNTSTWSNGYSNTSTDPWLNLTDSTPVLIPAMGTETMTASQTVTYSGVAYAGSPVSLTTTLGANAVINSPSLTDPSGTNVGGYTIAVNSGILPVPTSQNSPGGLTTINGWLTILPANLLASTTASKVYDGNASIGLTGSNTSFIGVDGQTATLSGSLTGILSNPNVGNNIGGHFSNITGSDLVGSGGFLISNYIMPSIFSGGSILPVPAPPIFSGGSILPVPAPPVIQPSYPAGMAESESILIGLTPFKVMTDPVIRYGCTINSPCASR